MKKSPPFIRLYKKISTSGDCWVWTGQTGSSGYGQIKAFGKMVSCHRLSYELNKGPIPKGLEVMHSCDNGICINPDHLTVGTHLENMRDMIAKERRVQGKSNAAKGVNKNQSHQVVVLGKPYGSLNEAERCLNLGSGTVAYWIKNSPQKARRITKQEYMRMVKNG